MSKGAKTQAERRILWIGGGAAVWVLIIMGRLVSLQVFHHEEYLRQADAQQVQTVEVQAPRGSIYDRNGQPLALSAEVESVYVNPRQIADLEFAADLLSRILSLDRTDLLKRLSIKTASRNNEKLLRGFAWVKRRITPDEAAQLKSLKLDWIRFQAESQRLYPKAELGRPVIGTVDHSEAGNSGIELGMNDELKGKNGSAQVLTDVKGASIESIELEKPQPGVGLTLTLDERVQFVAERQLKITVDERQAASGTIAVMRPDTGDVLAIASYVRNDPDSTLNLAVSSPFEPGSVFKVFTIAAALQARVVRPSDVFPCGVLTIGSRVLHEAKHAYGALTVNDILAKSSNVGAAQIGLRLGKERLYSGLKKFGFGDRTGLPLQAESQGRLRPDSRWKNDTIISVPMGHEVSTTTIQLAQACSVIANGGMLVKPRLVLKKHRPDGTVVDVPVARTERVLSPERAIEMRQMMESVVVAGTGKGARLAGYTAGGKTGSAQIFDPKIGAYTHTYNASFMGFAPVANPAIVIVVTINGTSGGSSGYGGAVAAPVFKTVAEEALRVMEIPKDLPETEPETPETTDESEQNDIAIPLLQASLTTPEPEPAADAAATPQVFGPRVPDFTGKSVRAVMEQASALGLPVIVDGKGRARVQSPLPGAVLPAGESIRVQFVR